LSKERATDPLVSAHVMIGEEQKKQLRLWAADRGTSMAELVREAIDYYLRVAVGPSPERIRRIARDAAGGLPRGTRSVPRSSDSEGECQRSDGGGGPSTHAGMWLAGEE